MSSNASSSSSPDINIKQQILQLLDASDTGGDYCTGGKLSVDYSVPAIEILQPNDGTYKPLPLPIKIMAIRSNNFRIINPKWNNLITDLVNTNVKKELGIGPEKTITFSLYKMLLYEPGGFFDFHRDSEKEDGMIATLVVQLPSSFTGGEIIVRHNEREKKFDCHHEQPIMHIILALIYNLKYSGSDKIAVVDSSHQVQTLEKIIESWLQAPMYSKLCYILQHKYSTVGLSPTLLKGKDETAFQLFQKIKSVKLEHSIDETTLVYTAQISSQENNQRLALVEDEIFPDPLRKSMTLTARDIEHTGNEGTTIERSYKSACLLICPTELKPLLDLSSREYLEPLFQAYSSNPTEHNKRLLMAYTSSKLTWSVDTDRETLYLENAELLTQCCLALSYLPLSLKCVERLWMKTGLEEKSRVDGVVKLIKNHGIEHFKPLFEKYIRQCFKWSYKFAKDIKAIGSLVVQLEDPTWVDVFITNLPSAKTISSVESEALIGLALVKEKFPSTTERIDKLIHDYLRSSLAQRYHPNFSPEAIIKLNMVELCPMVFKSFCSSHPMKMEDVDKCLLLIRHFGCEKTDPFLSKAFSKTTGSQLPKLIKVLEQLITKDGKEEQFLASKMVDTLLESKDDHVDAVIQLLTFFRKKHPTREVEIVKNIIEKRNYSAKQIVDLIQGLAKENGTNCFWTGSGFRLLLEHGYKLLQNAASTSPEAVLALNLGGNNKWIFKHVNMLCSCEDCSKVQTFLHSTNQVLDLKERKNKREHVEKNLPNIVDLQKQTITTGSPQTLRITKVLNSAEVKKSLITEMQKIMKEFVQYATLSNQSPNTIPAASSSSEHEPPTKKIKQEQQQ
ncbi:hypothetical protein C9374_002918 [Naegleria lovaniensis]|uniref:Prolyl 4-hydroxylase alpha subunit domain-containing protein n=1 Tax=Naegleria lovaniensis TaxID=51637 RepID=A0AA88GTC8_NAELO|nr:uncharacterized protein C9374_002918 [Naegleria lovaniensis]KAG2385769.1 hypothetical protein C9374_002918 [Naegleria lovaniensis]